MDRILLGVGVFAHTLGYPKAWLFEPFFFPLYGVALPSLWTALTPAWGGCQAGECRCYRPCWKKIACAGGLNPDHQGIWSATLSVAGAASWPPSPSITASGWSTTGH